MTDLSQLRKDLAAIGAGIEAMTSQNPYCRELKDVYHRGMIALQAEEAKARESETATEREAARKAWADARTAYTDAARNRPVCLQPGSHADAKSRWKLTRLVRAEEKALETYAKLMGWEGAE